MTSLSFKTFRYQKKKNQRSLQNARRTRSSTKSCRCAREWMSTSLWWDRKLLFSRFSNHFVCRWFVVQAVPDAHFWITKVLPNKESHRISPVSQYFAFIAENAATREMLDQWRCQTRLKDVPRHLVWRSFIFTGVTGGSMTITLSCLAWHSLTKFYVGLHKTLLSTCSKKGPQK